MRKNLVPIVGIVVILCAVCSAAAANRVIGSAYTQNATEKVTVRVWALGEALLKDPAKLDAPLAETTAAPGAEFALDLGDAAPPWEVEVSAPGHVAAAFKVILPEQMKLPPIWLPAGKELAVRVDASGKPAKGARVAGAATGFGLSDEPGRWVPVVSRATVDASGAAKVWVPDSGMLVVSARASDGRWGRVSKRLPVGGPLVVKVDSRAQQIAVRNPRGEPVPGISVAAANAHGTLAVTNEAGKASLQVPSDGTVAVVALGSGVAGRAVGRAGKGEIAITVDTPQELRLAWSGAPGSMIAESEWVPSALTGGAPLVIRGERGSIPFLPPGGQIQAWGLGVAPQTLRVETAERALALRFAAAARIDGAVIDEGNNAVGGVPVWYWGQPRYPGMPRMRRGGTGLARTFLPVAVSGANGAFSVAGVTPGATKLSAHLAGMPPAESDEFEAPAGGTSKVTLQLKRGAPLTLQTVDASGRILSGVSVKVFRSGNERGGAIIMMIRSMRDADEAVASGSTDKEGKLSLQRVSTGKIYLKLELPGYVTRTIDAELSAEGKDLGQQTLEPGVTVTGRVIDERGQEVADAEIYCNPLGVDLRMGAPAARSDASGFFAIADQPRQGELLVSARGDKIPSSDPVKVTLPPTGPVEIKVRRARTLDGRVVDERSGDQVPGVRINASKQIRRSFGGGMMQVGTSTFWASAESDESGAFRLEGMDVGECTVEASAAGFKRASLDVTIPEDAAPRPLTIVLRKGLALHGKVIDAQGTPLAGVEITTNTAGSDQRYGASFARGTSPVRSDPEGVFVVDGLDKGRYQLVAFDETGGQAREIVEAGRGDNVILRLQAPGALQVRVAGSDNAPISGARVSAYARGTVGGSDEKRTDSLGVATFENAAVGTYQVVAATDGLAPDSKTVTVESGRTVQVELTLKPGGTVLGKVLGLSPEELKACEISSGAGNAEPKPDGTFRLEGARVGINEITAFVMPQGKHRLARAEVKDITTPVNVEIDFSSGATLSGTVRRAGRPAAGVTVQAVGRGQRGGSSTTTDGDGTWEIKGLDPGELQVSALNDQGQALVTQTVQAVRDARVDLEVPGGVITGRITDADTRQPVPGAQAKIVRRDPPAIERVAQSDDTGAFRAAELPDGGYTIRVMAPGYASAESGATISMGRGQDVQLTLQPEQRLTLIVREADGGVPDQVLVLPMRDGRVEDMIWVSCDRDGRATITSLLPGAYTAMIAGRGAALVRFTVPGPDLAVQLSTTGRLDVTTPSEKGAAPWRVRVAAQGSGTVVPLGAYINPARGEWAEPPSGILRMRLPAGVYTVQAIDPRGGSHEQQVTIPPDGDASARFGVQ